MVIEAGSKAAVLVQVRDPVTGCWRTVSDGWATQALLMAVYGALAAGGACCLVSPPEALVDSTSYWFSLAWGLMLAVGGLTGGASVARGWWWLEKAGLCLLVGGGLIYVSVLVDFQVADGGGNRWPGVAVGAALVLLLVTRFLRIRRYRIDPEVLVDR